MLLPLYTGLDDLPTLNINSDTYPGTGGLLGLTRSRSRTRSKTAPSRPAAPGSPTSVVRTTRSLRCRATACGALQPRALLPRGSVLRAALVPEAPERLAASRPPRRRAGGAADRSELQGAARPKATHSRAEGDGVHGAPQLSARVRRRVDGGYMDDAGIRASAHRSPRRMTSAWRGHLDAWVASCAAKASSSSSSRISSATRGRSMIEGPSEEAPELVELKLTRAVVFACTIVAGGLVWPAQPSAQVDFGTWNADLCISGDSTKATFEPAQNPVRQTGSCFVGGRGGFGGRMGGAPIVGRWKRQWPRRRRADRRRTHALRALADFVKGLSSISTITSSHSTSRRPTGRTFVAVPHRRYADRTGVRGHDRRQHDEMGRSPLATAPHLARREMLLATYVLVPSARGWRCASRSTSLDVSAPTSQSFDSSTS